MLIWIQVGYIGGFFFWLDFMALISIIPDIPWMADAILTAFGYDQQSMQELSVTRASRAAKVGSRAGRLARLLRLVRILRVMRVFRLFKFMQTRKARRNTKDLQNEMSTNVVDSISKRVVIVVLVVVFVCFACQDIKYDYSRINGLVTLNGFDEINNLTSKSSQYSLAYQDSFQQNVDTYVKQQSSTLLYLQVHHQTLFPKPTVPGYCCQDPRTHEPMHQHFLRIEELMRFTVDNSSKAFFDQRDHLQYDSMLQMIIIVIIIVVLLSASFDFSQIALTLIRAPVEQLVVAQQTMEALLEVFTAVTHDNTNIDQTMDTITGACCKALDAERVNLFFVDNVSQQLWCRSTQQLDMTLIEEHDENDLTGKDEKSTPKESKGGIQFAGKPAIEKKHASINVEPKKKDVICIRIGHGVLGKVASTGNSCSHVIATFIFVHC